MTAENDSLFNILVLREVSYLFNEKVFIQLKKKSSTDLLPPDLSGTKPLYFYCR